MNFLHYAIFMFVICAAVMVFVSLATKAPSHEKLAGLTFATVDDKLDTVAITGAKPALARETAGEHRLNVVFSILLVVTVVFLWVYFR